jgi:Recombinase zinc beta ribbon domain/Recombinase
MVAPSTSIYLPNFLTRRTYTGVRNFNEFARKSNGERKAQSEIVEYQVPAIIDQATFEAVQALPVSRHPRSKGPRLSAAPSLLGGLVRCDCEKSCSLTTATGTSRTGVIYAYYKCVQAIKQGRHKEGSGANCVNRKIPRPVIEKLVVDASLNQPERVTSILLALKARRTNGKPQLTAGSSILRARPPTQKSDWGAFTRPWRREPSTEPIQVSKTCRRPEERP